MDSSGISAENPSRTGVPSATEVLVSIIAPVRDMDSDARALLEALDQQTVPREQYEVILADDGSVSRSIAELATPDDHVRVLVGPRANSYAARNRAIAAARGRLIATCDADCRPERDWLERGISAMRRADIVAGMIRFNPSSGPTVWALLDMTTFLDQRRAVSAGYGVTANLFFRHELFDRIGGFDDSQPNQGDYDFVSRCVAGGAKLAFASDATVWHPTRDSARRFLRKLWAVNGRYAEREAAAGRKPEGLKLRNWVPIVQTVRARRRVGRPIGLDRERLAESGIMPTFRDHLRTLPLIYLVVPYVSGLAQLQGWAAGRRRRRAESFDRARARPAESPDA